MTIPITSFASSSGCFVAKGKMGKQNLRVNANVILNLPVQTYKRTEVSVFNVLFSWLGRAFCFFADIAKANIKFEAVVASPLEQTKIFKRNFIKNPTLIEENLQAGVGFEVAFLSSRGHMTVSSKSVILKRVKVRKTDCFVKEVDCENLSNIKQIARESWALRKLMSLGISDLFVSSSENSITTRFVEGVNLSTLLENGHLTEMQKWFVVARVAEELEKIHSAGIVHADIKVENIMVTPEGYVRIIDFGEARKEGSLITREERFSEDFQFSPNYAAPELMMSDGKGNVVIKKSMDVFGLGMIVAEMFGREKEALSYRNGVYSEAQNDFVLSVLQGLLKRDPDKRMGLATFCNNIEVWLRKKHIDNGYYVRKRMIMEREAA